MPVRLIFVPLHPERRNAPEKEAKKGRAMNKAIR